MKVSFESNSTTPGLKTSIYLKGSDRNVLRNPPRGTSMAVARTIDRYYNGIILPLYSVIKGQFCEAEWQLLSIACNDATAKNSHEIWSSNAIPGGILVRVKRLPAEPYEKLGLDRKAVERKIASLSIYEIFALFELIEARLEQENT